MQPKYSGERELEDILSDNNWIKLGACEIACVGVYDTEAKKDDDERMDEVNSIIQKNIKSSAKPKSQFDLLKEQNEELQRRLEIIENSKETKKQAELGLQTTDEGRKKLESKATELGITFRANIGDVKLLAKIQELEPEFTL